MRLMLGFSVEISNDCAATKVAILPYGSITHVCKMRNFRICADNGVFELDKVAYTDVFSHDRSGAKMGGWSNRSVALHRASMQGGGQ